MFAHLVKLVTVLCWTTVSWALAPTDCISYACDPTGSGHNPRHNISPELVQNPNFRVLWNKTFEPQERWYAQHLVYTPDSGRTILFTASAQNYVRTLDAVTGEVLFERQLELPVLEADVLCKNIPFYYGITGTPVIDPETDTVYFYVNGYRDNDQSGGILNITYRYVVGDATASAHVYATEY